MPTTPVVIDTISKQEVPEEFDRIASGYDRLSAMNPGYQKHLEWSARRLSVPQSSSAPASTSCSGKRRAENRPPHRF